MGSGRPGQVLRATTSQGTGFRMLYPNSGLLNLPCGTCWPGSRTPAWLTDRFSLGRRSSLMGAILGKKEPVSLCVLLASVVRKGRPPAGPDLTNQPKRVSFPLILMETKDHRYSTSFAYTYFYCTSPTRQLLRGGRRSVAR
jgi:hypothetical protein